MGICWECVATEDTISTIILWGLAAAFIAMYVGILTLIVTVNERRSLILSISIGIGIWFIFIVGYLYEERSYSVMFYKTNEVLQKMAHLPDELVKCVVDDLPEFNIDKNIYLVQKTDFNNLLEACELKHGKERLNNILSKE